MKRQALGCTRPDPPARREERAALVSRTRHTPKLTEGIGVTKTEKWAAAKVRALVAKLRRLLREGVVL
jgi:hypothetical protein